MINRALTLFSLFAIPIATVHGASGSKTTSGTTAIISSLTTITNDLTKINDTLNGFDGGILGTVTALQIQGDSDQLVKDINQATKVVNATDPLNDSDSLSISSAVLNLEPTIFSVLSNLVAHHSTFETALLGLLSATWLVEDDLKSQKTSTDALGAAITAKLSAEFQSIAPVIIQQIDSHFESAIKTFSS